MSINDWFLTTEERGNPWTRIDRRHEDRAYTRGNRAHVLVHGERYFARLHELVSAQREGDVLMFTDWRGDPTERMREHGPTIAELLSDAARRGVIVKGLFWRSHVQWMHYFESENRTLADDVRAAGGEVVLDQRVLPMGSHHQKFVVLRHRDQPERDVAFVGGIDMCFTRRDTIEHLGDPQPVEMGAIWGKTPAWHDLMMEVHGPAVGDVEATFRERWEDPTPPALDPISRTQAYLHRDDDHPQPLPPQFPDPPEIGTHHIQVLRTFPPKVPRFPFAPQGERSIARAYGKASSRAERMIYLEDQYIWNAEVVQCFAEALRTHPGLQVIIVLSTFTSANTTMANASADGSRLDALEELLRAGGERVGIYGIENHLGTPVYVHSKICVVDDVWMTIGSDNVNLRSWTFDSELTCAILDEETDDREPRVLRSDNDPVRRLPRETRLELAREHLDRNEGDDADLIDPADLFTAFATAAARLDQWYASGQQGPRPAGRLRAYQLPKRPRGITGALGRAVYHVGDDPDARPRRLRGTGQF